ncbi:retrovirus-related Pol polyprotein from transposon RE2 [Nicotiana tabacum]|uniref:Retrovirus-related Pol polyprotein from transposon RE2 n=1 Tax=Nicotiana tabacum TaxID=4097 RepID=A0AC58U612_TOBAC
MNLLPPISKAYSLLQQDESQREAHFATPNFSGDATSFLVSPGTSTTNRNFSQKVNFEARKTAPNVSCKYCKKPGHTIDKCYRLHGFPADFKFTKSKKYASCVQTKSIPTTIVTSTSQHADISAHGFTKEQYQHLLTLLQQAQMSNTSTLDASNVDHSAFAHFAGLFIKYVVDSEGSHVCASSQLGVNPWILDTGATNHMTPHKHLLFNVQPLIKPFSITLPNGYKAKVISTGSLYLRHDIILLHVLLVPSFHFNLISVHQLICQLDCSALFTKIIYSLQGLSLKRPLEIGKAAGRLYYLHPDTDLFLVPLSSMIISSSSTLPNSVSIVSDKSNHVVTHVNGTHALQIDIWGSYNTRTYSGFRYFLTLVDDYTRATWTRLLSCKSNALSVLKAFTGMVKVHFKLSVQTFRSDNAFELGGSSQATKFFSSQGILHQTTILHIPQQNGVVERKYKHLLEVSRAFPFQSNLPLKYWGDCILTVTYLINKFPSIVLKNLSPYEKLHGFPPLYDHLKSFGYFVDSTASFPSPSPAPVVSSSQDSHVPSFPSPTPLSVSPSVISSPPPLRKSTRTVQQPSYLKDYACSSVLSSNSLPHSSKEVMLKEFQALEANQTLDIVPQPPHKKVIPCKWVYKIKQRIDGFIERCKARLVIRGDTQKVGIDFTKIFSLVVKLTIIKCLLILAAKWGWTIFQLDVNNAFLHGDLHE